MGEIITLERARKAGDVRFVFVYRIGDKVTFKAESGELTGEIVGNTHSSDHSQNIHVIKVGEVEHRVLEKDVIETEYVQLF